MKPLALWLCVGGFLAGPLVVAWQQPGKGPEPDLKDYCTVETALTVKETSQAGSRPREAYLGVVVERAGPGKLKVIAIAPKSPADLAGLRVHDLLLRADAYPLLHPDVLRAWLLTRRPGDQVELELERGGERSTVKATLGTLSRPLALSKERSWLGIQVADVDGEEGVRVTAVTRGSPAEKAGVQVNDTLLTVDDVAVRSRSALNYLLLEKAPRDTVRLTLDRAGKELCVQAELVLDPQPDVVPWAFFVRPVYDRPEVRLAVVPVAAKDEKPNPKITPGDWNDALFSRGTYKDRANATGQKVYGSLNDYFEEVSYGKLKVSGKVFPLLQLPRPKSSYAWGDFFVIEAKEALEKREGKEALQNYDCFVFIFTGPSNPAGKEFTPWFGVFGSGKSAWNAILLPEGGPRMTAIGVLAHEVGHFLGVPDLYDRPEVENPGRWCTMGVGHGTVGKPVHFSAWAKERLGWLRPTVIDPVVPQKLILRPVYHGASECYKVPVSPGEYFLLENRCRRGFDIDLPGEGLLIWRVRDGKPVLEESHGIEGPVGPRVFLSAVPFPSACNDSFTPYTTPSSRSLGGAAAPLHLTHIRRLADGRITFWIGYEAY